VHHAAIKGHAFRLKQLIRPGILDVEVGIFRLAYIRLSLLSRKF